MQTMPSFSIKFMSRNLINECYRRYIAQLISVLIGLILIVPVKTFSQTNSRLGSERAVSNELNSGELSQVIQSCIDLPEIQKYYPTNSDKSIKPINILQYPISFPSDLSVAKAGQAVRFINVSDQPKNSNESYFMFRSMEKSGDNLKLAVNYFYLGNTEARKMLSINLELKKSGSGWNIVNFNLKEDSI